VRRRLDVEGGLDQHHEFVPPGDLGIAVDRHDERRVVPKGRLQGWEGLRQQGGEKGVAGQKGLDGVRGGGDIARRLRRAS